MERKMKDSGIPWIGMIPSDWEVCYTKQLMRNKSIKGFPDEQVLSLYRDYGVVPKDSRDDNHNVTSEDTASYKLVEVGDFVINKMKAWQGSMAISAYRGIISPAYYICRFTNESVNRRYIHYLLRNETYKTEYRRLSTGLRVGQWDLNIDDFLHIPAILPPLPTQQRIADFLDRKCAEIDELAALQETMIAELKRYKQSVITEAVTKGLDTNVPMKDSGVEWIGEIPEGWMVRKIKDVAFFLNGDRGKNYPSGDDMVKEGIYFLTSNNIRGIIVDCDVEISKFITLERYNILGGAKIQLNDIIYCLRGSIGNCAINKKLTQGTVASSLMTIRPTHISSDFLNYYLHSQMVKFQTEEYMNGSCAANLSAENVSRYIVMVPPLAEQRAIADCLDRKCAEIDELIAIKHQKIEALKEYKKSVIFEYVTGKKEVEG